MYKSLFDCAGKVAVVTGGAGLLGREIAKGLSAFGAKVVMADADVAKARTLAPAANATAVRFDITRLAAIGVVLAQIKKRMGRLDILVNGAYPRTRDWGDPCERVRPSSWRKNVDAQMGGYFFSSLHAAELMKAQGGGTIINIASIYGLVAPDFGLYRGTSMTMPAAYAAIKGGVLAFTKYLAVYYASAGVRVNAISPGGVRDRQSAVFVKRYARKTPLGRMANPGDMVGAAVFLASDASAYVTGSNLVVDGGWTAW